MPVPLTVKGPVALVMLISVVGLVVLIVSKVVALSHGTCVDAAMSMSCVSRATTPVMATTP